MLAALLALFILSCKLTQGLPATPIPTLPTKTLTSTTKPTITSTITPTLLPSLTPTLLPTIETAFTEEGRVMYIDSGIVKIGVDKDWGGAIREIWFNGQNLVNNWDGGRLIAVSLYDGDSQTGFNAGDPDWGWNPCPSDKHNAVNRIIAYSYDVGTLYVKSRYLEWNPDNKGGGKGSPVPTDTFVETWLQFVAGDPQAINVSYRVTHEGSHTHALAGQEMGFAFTRTPFNRFVTYRGNAPWSGASPSFETLLPFPTRGNTAASEQWAGFVNSEDVGLMEWAPQSYPIFNYVYFDNIQGNREENSTNYLGPRAFFAIEPGFSFEMQFFLFAGRWQEARSRFNLLRQTVSLQDVMPTFGYVDAPAQNATLTGTFDVAGWVIDDRKVAKIEIRIDGIRLGEASYGISRPDVDRDYPGLPGAPNFGFLYPLDTTTLSNGAHTLEVLAMDTAGNTSLLKPGRLTINILN